MKHFLDDEGEAKRIKGIELNRSRPFDVMLWSDSPEVDYLAEDIHKRMISNKALKRVHHSTLAQIKVVLLNLYSTYWVHPEMYVAYPRGCGSYKAKGNIYNPSRLSRKVVQIVDALNEAGLIIHHKGKHYPEIGLFRVSRMRATDFFIEVMEEGYDFAPEVIDYHSEEPLLVLRKKDAKGRNRRLQYTLTPELSILNSNVARINAVNSCAEIYLDVSDETLKRIQERLFRSQRDDDYVVDFTRVGLARVFNNGSFKQGGRFYKAWWQRIPSEYRPMITIDGSKTVEADYSAIHPTIAYALEKKPCPPDPYYIKGCPSRFRFIIKIALLCIINADNRVKAIQATRNEVNAGKPELLREFNQDFKEGLDKLFTLIEEAHEPIRDNYFYSGMWSNLQYHDSQLAEKVMLNFVDDGIPILPIHDSFIVENKYKDRLMRVMRVEFMKMFGVEPKVDLKGK